MTDTSKTAILFVSAARVQTILRALKQTGKRSGPANSTPLIKHGAAVREGCIN